MTDDAKPEPTPAKVHGDGGTSAVIAEVAQKEAEDIEASEDADVARLQAIEALARQTP